jgi:hypothetical protein
MAKKVALAAIDSETAKPVEAGSKNDAATEPTKAEEPQCIVKSTSFSLEKFRSKHSAAIANVETLLTALPHHKIANANDWVRLNTDPAYSSVELCFVDVPIEGQKRDHTHLIVEEIAEKYLNSKRIKRFKLVLATKPYDKFFLCHVPTRNLDNSFNATALKGCEQANVLWTMVTSRRDEGIDEYKVEKAKDADAFPPPHWPKQTLEELIGVTFAARLIDTEDHPALLRLIGARQSMS